MVRQRLDAMLDEIDEIDVRLPTVRDEYLLPSSDSLRHELEHRLYVALQAVLDVAAHIAVCTDVRDLYTYRDAVEALGRVGALDWAFAAQLSGVAGMRNAIAHDYLDLDHGLIYDAMQRTDDLKRFAAEIWKWLEGQ